MDPLSNVCSSLNVKDVESGHVQIVGSWEIRIPAYRDVVFVACVKGSFWLSIDGLDQPILIEEGDCFLVVNHLGHRIGSEPDIESAERSGSARTHSVIWRTNVVTQHVVIRHPGDCDTALIGARFVFEDAKAKPLFDLLPPVIHIRANSDVAPTFRSLLQVLAAENAARQVGGTVMTNNLAHILLVQALRTHVAAENLPRGWLAALIDVKIGAALALMNRDGAREWTVEDLATAVGMSRSSFALRFKTVVGQAPLDYWLQWRMHRAGQMLRNTNRSVSSVAFAWGYESEKSFRKAFKRTMGCAPTSYRMADPVRPIDANH
jgi:AraC-like DNA-binding protein